MRPSREYAVVGPLPVARDQRCVLGVELVEGRPRADAPRVFAWVPAEVARDPRLLARLERETALASELAIHGVERVYGLESFAEGWARVVEYTDGKSLEQILELCRERRTSVPMRVVARVLADACDAIGAAHDQGLASAAGRPITHGALRLDTVSVLFGGGVRVTGFGAAAALWTGPAERPAFLTPEQVIGGRASASVAGDVYGLGAVLYALISGREPFVGEPDVESAVLALAPARPPSDGSAARLFEVAVAAMAKRGPERLASTAVLKAAVVAATGDVGLATDEELAAFLEELVPAGGGERSTRNELLAALGDMDALTPLSRTPAERTPSAEITADEFRRPAPPREEVTQTDGRLPETTRVDALPVVSEPSVSEPAARKSVKPPPAPPSASLPSMPDMSGWRPSAPPAARASQSPGKPSLFGPLFGDTGPGAPMPGAEVTQVGPPPIAPLEVPTFGVPEERTAVGPQPTMPGPSGPSEIPSLPLLGGSPPQALLGGLPAASPLTPSHPPSAAPTLLGGAPPLAASVPPAAPPHLTLGASFVPAVASVPPATAVPGLLSPSGSFPALGFTGPASALGAARPSAPAASLAPSPIFGAPSASSAPPTGAALAAASQLIGGTPTPVAAPASPALAPMAPSPAPLGAPTPLSAPAPPSPALAPAPMFSPPAPRTSLAPPGFGAPFPGPSSPPPATFAGMPSAPPGYGAPHPSVPATYAGTPSIPPAPYPYGYPYPPPGYPTGAYPPVPPQGYLPPGYPTGAYPPVPPQAYAPPGYPTGAYPSVPPQPLPTPALATGTYPPVPAYIPSVPPGPASSGRPSFAPAPSGRPSAPPGRTSIPPSAVQTPTIGGKPSMPPQPVSAIPRAPIREASSITDFKKNAGDGSRSILVIGVVVLVAVFGIIIAFPKAPPADLAETPTRHALPKELVREALSGGKVNELPPADEPPPVSPPASPSGAPAASASGEPLAPAEPKTGHLALATEPAVDVYVGAKLIGRTPLRVELPTGVHKVRFTDGDKMINLYKSYRVRGGGEVKDELSFGTSQLKVLAPNGAQITLNGRELGVAPLPTHTIFEGKYVLKVVHDGKSWSQTFEAPPGRTIDYKVWIEDK